MFLLINAVCSATRNFLDAADGYDPGGGGGLGSGGGVGGACGGGLGEEKE